MRFDVKSFLMKIKRTALDLMKFVLVNINISSVSDINNYFRNCIIQMLPEDPKF